MTPIFRAQQLIVLKREKLAVEEEGAAAADDVVN